ncbi:MAG TPA: hypothetical protein V6D28_27255 [Leptolyngbyaceae cyanobacterium]
MNYLIKVTGIFTLTIGLQFIHVQANLAALQPQNSIQIQEYQPPTDRGGPNSSQGAGTR